MTVSLYADLNFVEFFGALLTRFFLFITGQGGQLQLAADEMQLLVLVGIAISGALVGTFLFFQRMTMLANALSHTILLGIVLSFMLARLFGGDGVASMGHQLPFTLFFVAALLTALLTALTTQFLVSSVRLQSDASTGLVFTTFFAVGVLLVSVFTRNAHIGIEVVMGNVDGLQHKDLVLTGVILLLNCIVTYCFYRGYIVTSFDPSFAGVLGFSRPLYHYVLMLQTAITCVGAFRAVGVLMVLSFLTAPVLIARALCAHFFWFLCCAIASGVLACLLGVGLSRHILTVTGSGMSTGGLVVCTLVTLYGLVLLYLALRRYRLSKQNALIKEQGSV